MHPTAQTIFNCIKKHKEIWISEVARKIQRSETTVRYWTVGLPHRESSGYLIKDGFIKMKKEGKNIMLMVKRTHHSS